MPIEQCRIIGIEGSHGTGKSTLALAVAAECKRRHIHAACLTERARHSPFVEDAVIHKTGKITVHGELHLLASQIEHEHREARYHQVLVCDKTVANVLGYSRLLLDGASSNATGKLIRALQPFLAEYVKLYESVFFCNDLYDLTTTEDPFRPRDPLFQQEASGAIRQACADLALPLVDIPTGLSHDERVAFVIQRICPAD